MTVSPGLKNWPGAGINLALLTCITSFKIFAEGLNLRGNLRKKRTQEGDSIPPCMKNWPGAGNMTQGAALYAGDHILRHQDFSSFLQKISRKGK